MLQVKIIDVPPGEAPDWVRNEWVGLSLPLAENVPSVTHAIGVLGGEVKNPSGYHVETEKAIQILEEKSPEAAQWWKNQIIPSLMKWLVFKEDVCELQ